MTQQASRRLGPLGTLGLAAAALLVAAGAAGTAQADDAPLPVTITGEDRVGLSLESDNGDPSEPQVMLRLNAPGEEFEGDGVIPPVFTGDYTVRIDATALAGVASVQLPCAADGLVAVCTGSELYAGERYNRLGGIRLDIDEDSEAGDFGSITVTGEGEGLDFTPLTVDVLVGGPEFLNHELPLPGDYRAGDIYRAPVGLRNAGGMSAEGAVLRLHGSRGVSFPDSYGNCSYAEVTTGPLLHQGTDVLCTFPDTIDAGTAYALTEPLRVRTADFALHDIFTYAFTAVGPSEAAGLRAAKDYRPGTGADLRLRKVPDAEPAEYSRYADVDLPTTNTYDLELTGAAVDAEAGDTVTAEIGFRNNGPAWISALRSGGEPIGFTVGVPEGATVTALPEGCRSTTLEGGEEGYLCWVSTPLLEDAELTFPFELRVDRVVEGAKAEVALPEWGNPFESDHANDSAWIVLNGSDGSTDGGTGQTDGGTSGGTAPPGPGQDGDSGSSGTSGSSGSGGTSGSSGSGASGTSGDVTGGGLASTGAGGAALIGGAALLALGLGAGLFLFLRRGARHTGGTAA
ncbi:hypothetical protein [Streptomyces capillispiralis]|uniref:LPXTG-motif cell wall-anchored protein n=1 Tax=Streptomyces capillispiralis TaxID=68182 RepID=A0A561TFK9_9ACTN|nr:hypothetical protein [Streptomyces capillispiralis]TWF85907.1 hypothetical protein FHX78_112865 [Streptomyces capillispiralis]GHH89583.1 hypothetical protein GCM10017779_01290 [Streptomyces capillispiralis]